MTDRALTAWILGRQWARAARPLPPDLPEEGFGYWVRRGYFDPFDR